MAEKPKSEAKMVCMKCNESSYPYELRIRLSLDQMKELGADTTPPIGLKMMMEAKVKVVSVSTNESTMGDPNGSVEFQITDLMFESPELETEEEKKEREKKRNSAEVMYGPR